MFGLLKETPVVGKADTLILSPPESLFSFIGVHLIENYPRWSPEVKELEKLTDGPVKAGTLCRQVRVDQGNRSESTFKVEVFEPGMRISFEGVSKPYRCDYLIESVDEKMNRVTFIFELLDLDLHMKPFEKLIRVAIQDGAARTVRNIKKIIEAENS